MHPAPPRRQKPRIITQLYKNQRGNSLYDNVSEKRLAQIDVWTKTSDNSTKLTLFGSGYTAAFEFHAAGSVFTGDDVSSGVEQVDLPRECLKNKVGLKPVALTCLCPLLLLLLTLWSFTVWQINDSAAHIGGGWGGSKPTVCVAIVPPWWRWRESSKETRKIADKCRLQQTSKTVDEAQNKITTQETNEIILKCCLLHGRMMLYRFKK